MAGWADLLGRFEPGDLIGLWAFRPFYDVELDLISLLEGLIAVQLDGAVMDEDVGSLIPAEESVTFCVIEPLDGAFVLSH